MAVRLQKNIFFFMSDVVDVCPVFNIYQIKLPVFYLHLIIKSLKYKKCLFLFSCFGDQAFSVPENLEIGMLPARGTEINQYPWFGLNVES